MTVTEEKTPNFGRRILWLGAFIVILFGGYTVGWYYLADRLVTETQRRSLTPTATAERSNARIRPSTASPSGSASIAPASPMPILPLRWV